MQKMEKSPLVTLLKEELSNYLTRKQQIGCHFDGRTSLPKVESDAERLAFDKASWER